VPVTAAALDAQFRLQQRMVAGITATYHAVNYVQQLRAAIAAHTPAAASGAADALKTLDEAVAPLDGSGGVFGLAHRDLARRLNDQLVGDLQPTPSVISGVDAPCAAIGKGLDTLRQLQMTSLAELNAALPRTAGPLPAWRVPDGPPCGR
jgi:hypothetical protein